PLSRGVLNCFRELGLIGGSANRDCALGGLAYRPGKGVPKSYKVGEREFPFWELATCGVEPVVGRGCNWWALGPCWEGVVCPSCGTHYEQFDDPICNALRKAATEWIDDSGRALVQCRRCQKSRPIAEWQFKNPLGLGNLSFRFWNW